MQTVETGQMDANLVLLKKSGALKSVPLPSTVTVIGRRHDCDLRIPLSTISRRHCRISQNGQALEIHDLGSTWGTFVNDKRVNGSTSVKAGDYVRIGPLTFVCQINGEPEKIVPPEPPSRQAKPPKVAADEVAKGLDDSFADLDASDSFIALDDVDSDSDSDSDADEVIEI